MATMPDVLDLLQAPGQELIITPGEGDGADRDERFELACLLYPEAKVEMDEAGNIIVTPGNSLDSAYRSGEAFGQLSFWAKKDGTGRAFDATGNFNLPSGAKRQPDAAWVPRAVLKKEGRAALRTITKTKHVPTFLIEVTSPSDSFRQQKEKCISWIEGGVQEAFLVHPKQKLLIVYRPGKEGSDVSATEFPEAELVPSSVLAGFALDCRPIWEEL